MTEEWKNRVTGLAIEHGPMVFATAYRILGNCDDAQDAQQNVFLNLLNSWTLRLKAGRVKNWGAYLRVATIRAAVDLLRRRRRDAVLNVPFDENVIEVTSRDPRTVVIRRQHTNRLRDALANLPEKEAQVFALRFFEECTYLEIAAQTGLSVDRVGVLIHRARGRLRKMLDPTFTLPIQKSFMAANPELRDKEKSHVA